LVARGRGRPSEHHSWRDAAWIDAEVRRYAEDGVGDLRMVVLPSGRRVYALFLSGYRVVVTLDRATRTMHVWRVLRSLPTK
jgi:hypothetical protein